MKLYEMNEQWRAVAELLDDPETDQQAIFDTIELIEGSMDEKLEGYCKLVRSFEADAKDIDEEIARLRARKSAIDNRVKGMKARMYESMKTTGRSKVKTPLFSIWIQANPERVEIDPDKLEYLFGMGYAKPYKMVEENLDKARIKEEIKCGETIVGAAIVRDEGIRIR